MKKLLNLLTGKNELLLVLYFRENDTLDVNNNMRTFFSEYGIKKTSLYDALKKLEELKVIKNVEGVYHSVPKFKKMKEGIWFDKTAGAVEEAKTIIKGT